MSEVRTQLFISYSRVDESWLKRLQVHLRPVERDAAIEIWDDTRVQPGKLWREELRAALAKARVALLLVSPDFLGSDFICKEELSPLLAAHQQEGVSILPLILRPCFITSIESLSRIRSINDPAQPLATLPAHEQDALLAQTATLIHALFRGRTGSYQNPVVAVPSTPLLHEQARVPVEVIELARLDDQSCRTIARELLGRRPELMASGDPATLGVTQGAQRRFTVAIDTVTLTDQGLLRRLQHAVEMLDILEERILFLQKQKETPLGTLLNFEPEIRSKTAQRAEQLAAVREMLDYFVREIRQAVSLQR